MTTKKETIKFRFCRECSNLLYPKEDKSNNELIYACRTCHYSEDSDSPMVYATDHSAGLGETAGITQDVGSDPTVGDPLPFCTMCGDFISCEICAQSGVEACLVLEVESSDPQLQEQ